jgi:hypothetical protein
MRQPSRIRVLSTCDLLMDAFAAANLAIRDEESLLKLRFSTPPWILSIEDVAKILQHIWLNGFNVFPICRVSLQLLFQQLLKPQAFCAALLALSRNVSEIRSPPDWKQIHFHFVMDFRGFQFPCFRRISDFPKHWKDFGDFTFYILCNDFITKLLGLSFLQTSCGTVTVTGTCAAALPVNPEWISADLWHFVQSQLGVN